MAQAARPVIQSGGANSKTVRKSLTVAGSSITLPAKVQSVVFRNDGANDIRLRVNASGANYWTIKPGDLTPKIAVRGATLDAASVGGPSDLECFFEG